MSELKYDEETPYVFRFSPGDRISARFRNLSDANLYASNYAGGQVIDTTPKPKIPKDAEFIVVESEDVTKDIYQKMPDSREPDGYYWFRALDTMAYGVDEMDDLIGDSKVTALVRKESE